MVPCNTPRPAHARRGAPAGPQRWLAPTIAALALAVGAAGVEAAPVGVDTDYTAIERHILQSLSDPPATAQEVVGHHPSAAPNAATCHRWGVYELLLSAPGYAGPPGDVWLNVTFGTPGGSGGVVVDGFYYGDGDARVPGSAKTFMARCYCGQVRRVEGLRWKYCGQWQGGQTRIAPHSKACEWGAWECGCVLVSVSTATSPVLFTGWLEQSPFLRQTCVYVCACVGVCSW
jgi:hypothetical protein